jgi:ABC-type oligopeptide transport system substrate-binding subunit/DNA-binding SARP family transcriptional activator
MLRICTLGGFELWYGQSPLPLPATLKSQSLLAYLIAHRERPQPRDRLVDLFWGDRPERKARASLSTAVWHMRRCLPEDELILSDSHMLQFDPQAELWLDAEAFESLAAQGDMTDLQAAVDLYRGDFLEGFYDDWIINERYRLQATFLQALARLMTTQEARGEHEAALVTALRLLEQDPLREDAQRLAMRAYCRLGQRNAALEQYRRFQQVIREELGAQPMSETSELHQAILEGRFAVGHPPEMLPVPIRVIKPRPAGRDPLDALATSPWVGRQQEMALLDDCWQRAQAGQGELLLVSGEAGVGKTRLVDEFARRLRWQGVRVLWGRCYEFERVLPYQPLAEALRAIAPAPTAAELADLAPWAIAEVARLAPEIAELAPNRAVPAPTGPDQEQARLFEGLAHFMAELSSHGPLLVVLEDLHWATESTLGLLHYLVRHLADQPALMVGTFRQEAVGGEHLLRELQEQLRREGLVTSLGLSCLSQTDIEALVVGMSDAGEAVLRLARRLYQETEGNPFFLMEIVKALFESGALRLEEGVWKGDFMRISQGALPLPTSLSQAIQGRVHSLDDDAQEALRLAAVLGREFDFNLLNAAWGRGEEATLEALDVLLRRRLINEGIGPLGCDYAFSHHKIQEVLYVALPRRRRQHAHIRVGTAMERMYASQTEALAGELAYHFEQGQELDKTLTEKAIGYLHQAGDRARGLYAHREAIDYYQRALGLLKGQGEHERAARTLMKLGLTYHTAFDFQRARQAYDEGFALWQRAGRMRPAVLPPAPHPLRLDLYLALSSPDPVMIHEGPLYGLITQLFSGLVELTPELDVVPDVARGWEVLEEGRKYVFHLRDDVYWSDGARVTAGDFEYACKRALDPAYASPWGNLLYDVKGARAFHQGQVSDPASLRVQSLDATTLLVELEEPTGYFLQLLASIYPVPRHAVEVHGETWAEVGNIVTNGSFRLEAWRTGECLALVRNPTYHGHFTGNVERVEVCLLPEWSARLALYEADRLDVLSLYHLPPPEWDRVRQRHAGEYISVPELGTYYVGFDVSRPPFNDPRVRRAFALATDREVLANVTLRGYFAPATGGFIPPGMPGHSAGIGLPHDPERARQLLAEASYPGGRGFPKVEALLLDPLAPQGEGLRAQWRENLGVEVAWEVAEWTVFLDKLGREPPCMYLSGWGAEYPDPDSMLRRGDFLQWTCWRNVAYEGLVESVRHITDQEERMRMYQQADTILVEEAPIIPLTHPRHGVLVKPWVKKYPTSLLMLEFWFGKDVIIEPH